MVEGIEINDDNLVENLGAKSQVIVMLSHPTSSHGSIRVQKYIIENN